MDTEPLNRMLVQQGRRALARTKFLVDRLWQIFPVPRMGALSTVTFANESPELFQELSASFGLASTLLFDDGVKRSRETTRLYEIRLSRVQKIRARCTDLDFGILSNKRIRDRMVHIDEHLSKAFIANPDAYWLIDMGMSNRTQFSRANPGVQPMYCRVYIADERRILHLDEELDTSALYKACDAVLARLLEKTS